MRATTSPVREAPADSSQRRQGLALKRSITGTVAPPESTTRDGSTTRVPSSSRYLVTGLPERCGVGIIAPVSHDILALVLVAFWRGDVDGSRMPRATRPGRQVEAPVSRLQPIHSSSSSTSRRSRPLSVARLSQLVAEGRLIISRVCHKSSYSCRIPPCLF